MQPIYQHRQLGLVMLVFLIIPVIGFVLAISSSARPAPLLPVLILIGLMLFTMAVFSSMTVKVDAQQVQLCFGLSFLRRSFPIRQISAVRVVRNTLLMGLGIHFIPGGTIYNVSGLDAVEITLETGRRIRIGTDEPAVLARAIEQGRRPAAANI